MDRHLAHRGLLALIWIGVAHQLGGGIVLFRPDRKTCQDLGLTGLPHPDYRGRDAPYALDCPGIAGASRFGTLATAAHTLLAGVTLAGTLVHVVGANTSRPLLVERDHAQGRPSSYRHRPIRACSSSDLYRAYRQQCWRPALAVGNRHRAARRDADRASGLWQKARMEEGFLTVELGADAYGAYCRRVPMLVPFLPQR